MAGTLDIACACLFWGLRRGVPPLRIFQSVAAGLLGEASFALLCGAGYGLLLYAVMNYVVVPLSAAGGGGAKDPLWISLSIVVHALLIGVPIALLVRPCARLGGGHRS